MALNILIIYIFFSFSSFAKAQHNGQWGKRVKVKGKEEASVHYCLVFVVLRIVYLFCVYFWPVDRWIMLLCLTGLLEKSKGKPLLSSCIHLPSPSLIFPSLCLFSLLTFFSRINSHIKWFPFPLLSIFLHRKKRRSSKAKKDGLVTRKKKEKKEASSTSTWYSGNGQSEKKHRFSLKIKKVGFVALKILHFPKNLFSFGPAHYF